MRLRLPPMGLKGFFMLSACGPRGRRDLGWFPNLITDLGMDKMGLSTADLCTTMVVGSGDNPASASDTQLETFVAASTSNSPAGAQYIEMDELPFYVDRVVAKRFPVNFAGGDVNLSEVGIGWASNELFARSLIRDFAGNPTTITVLADEYLDVFYRIRVDPPVDDGVLSFNTGVAHTGAVRASVLPTNISSGYGFDIKTDGPGYYGYAYGSGVQLGDLTGSPTGALDTQPISAANGWDYYKLSYVLGSFEVKVRYSASPAGGNLTNGIFGLRSHTTLGFYQFVWTPGIPKTAETTLFLDVTYSWTRS